MLRHQSAVILRQSSGYITFYNLEEYESGQCPRTSASAAPGRRHLADAMCIDRLIVKPMALGTRLWLSRPYINSGPGVARKDTSKAGVLCCRMSWSRWLIVTTLEKKKKQKKTRANVSVVVVRVFQFLAVEPSADCQAGQRPAAEQASATYTTAHTKMSYGWL